MADPVPLPEDILRSIEGIGEVDILIGVPSYNNARTIGHVIKAVKAGLAKYFPGERSIIVNSDGGSTDGTQEIVAKTTLTEFRTILIHHPLYPIHKITIPYHGIPGKGSAFRTIFRIAEILRARACAVVDSDLRSITPEWIDLLISPVYREGYDFVAPLYLRHKYDGTITNSIVYPVTRALYGKRIRQPIGGEFGFSGRLASHYLTKDVWHTDVARFGIDIWMTTVAIAEGFKVCQSFLGAKLHDPKDPGTDLGDMMVQVVGSLFSLMETYSPVWREVRGSEPVPTFGFRYSVGTEPVAVNVDRMIHIFRHGLEDLKEVWKEVISPANMKALERAGRRKRKFHIPDEVWVKVVYDFAIAYHRRTLSHEHLIKSLLPLYLGKTASFVIETQKATSEEVEEVFERLSLRFEEEKGYLIKGWG